jgi:hypothetical protein
MNRLSRRLVVSTSSHPSSKTRQDVCFLRLHRTRHSHPDRYRKSEQKAVNSPTKPGKRSPVKKESLKSNSAQKEGYNPTTKAMAYDWVMKALDNMNSSPGLKKDLAEELGVKPANLINVSSGLLRYESEREC